MFKDNLYRIDFGVIALSICRRRRHDSQETYHTYQQSNFYTIELFTHLLSPFFYDACVENRYCTTQTI